MIKDRVDDARCALVALIAKPDDAGRIQGLDALSDEGRLFLLATCSAVMIEFAITTTAGNDVERSIKGLDALFGDMRKQIIEWCSSSELGAQDDRSPF